MSNYCVWRDFRQILSVVPKGRRADVVDTSLNSSYPKGRRAVIVDASLNSSYL